MRYYVVTDVHGYYDRMIAALEDKGYFTDTEPHKLIICGDLFDRGAQAIKMQEYITDLLDKDEVILIKGNHEDLIVEMIDNFYEYLPKMQFTHHFHNGTYNTAVALTRMNKHDIECFPQRFVNTMRNTPYFKKIIPAMRDYFETDNYIFVHGWVPCESVKYGRNEKRYFPMIGDWRGASASEWELARWHNGMAAWKCGVVEEGKTIVCGHFHTSWGHSVIDGKCTEWGPDADFSPYIKKGIIALDGATAFTKNVNCVVIDD